MNQHHKTTPLLLAIAILLMIDGHVQADSAIKILGEATQSSAKSRNNQPIRTFDKAPPAVAVAPIFSTSAPKAPTKNAARELKPSGGRQAAEQENAPLAEAAPPHRATPATALQKAEHAEIVSTTMSIPEPRDRYEIPGVVSAADHQTEEIPLSGDYIVPPTATTPAPHCLTCPNCGCQSGARTICGVSCDNCCNVCNATWGDVRRIPWSIFSQGEYVGPARQEHVFQYFLRVDDLIDLIYLESREKRSTSYVIGVGDQLRFEAISDPTLDRQITVQQDGTISLPHVGEIVAAGKTIAALREELEQRFSDVLEVPQVTVTPEQTNVPIQDVLAAVDAKGGSGGQAQQVRVTPEGTIQVPGIGSVYVQGLTLEELRRELEARYLTEYGPGLKVTPILAQRAPSYVFVGGEVASPGRYTLEGPTTVMQAIALAGGWNVGGNTNQIVVFRRDENWCLKATKIDLFKPLYGKDPCPVNDVWLRDNDLVLVPKRRIKVANDIIELYMTRGVYAAFPINFVYNFSNGSSIVPIAVGP